MRIINDEAKVGFTIEEDCSKCGGVVELTDKDTYHLKIKNDFYCWKCIEDYHQELLELLADKKYKIVKIENKVKDSHLGFN